VQQTSGKHYNISQTLESGIALATFFCLNYWFTLGKELFLDLRMPSSLS
jgi:hypothetical protein